MNEWFAPLFHKLSALQMQDVQATDWMPLLAILLTSAGASLALCLCYTLFFERRATGSDVHRTFPLLGVAITAIFVCLQYSLPMSLGLLGALSIVRFRMPLKEPEEIGFLMALIATSICCATLNLPMLLLLLLLTVALLLAMRLVPAFARSRRAVASLVVTTPAAQCTATLRTMLELSRALGRGRVAALDGIADLGEQSTITVSLFRGSAEQLAALLQALRERAPDAEVGLFVDRPRPLGEA